jgi:hypothetical protein
MKPMLNTLANLIVLVGIVVCVVAVAGSAYGESPLVLGLQPTNVGIAGIALMVFACFAKLEARP